MLRERQGPAARCSAFVAAWSTRFHNEEWWAGLKLAHAIGDLTGPSPEGRFPIPGAPSIAGGNKYKVVGIDKTFIRWTTDGGNRLVLRAVPGHPLCDKCKQPLLVTECENGVLSVQCPGCAVVRSYVRPDGLAPGFPTGVLAMDREQGGRHAEIQQDASGAMAIRCPNCSAPLDCDGKASVIRCQYCEIAVRIPSHALRSLGNGPAQALRLRKADQQRRASVRCDRKERRPP